MDEKFEPTTTAVVSSEVSDDTYLGIKTGTAPDALDMKRMGKDQELRGSLALFSSYPHSTHGNVSQRNFNFYTMFSLTALLILGWEAVLGTVAFGLLNGGTAGLIYDYMAVAILFMLVNVSMAEMASMVSRPSTESTAASDDGGGAHIWRSISLGQRIRSAQLAETGLVSDRMALCAWLANWRGQ